MRLIHAQQSETTPTRPSKLKNHGKLNNKKLFLTRSLCQLLRHARNQVANAKKLRECYVSKTNQVIPIH